MDVLDECDGMNVLYVLTTLNKPKIDILPPNLKKTAAMAVLTECTAPSWIYQVKRKRSGAMAVLREMYSPRLDLSG